jgi:sugar lactone lactonase YvrE
MLATAMALAPLYVTFQAFSQDQEKLLPVKAYRIPKETVSEESGYFSIVEGTNGKLYVGTAKYGSNAYLVEFDPSKEKMRIAVDAHAEIGTSAKGFAAQAKIHTRNNVGKSGRIYFGTKQGYPQKGETRDLYQGGYPMWYDPANGKTQVYPIPIKHQGIISLTPDESRGVAYLSTCSDERPTESTHFMMLDLKTGSYRDLMDCRHMYAFIVVDHEGRAYHPILGGDVARYDPKTKRLERLVQTIDGKTPKESSLLATPKSHPINWDVSPDGKTLYAVAMSGNHLYSYDLTATGKVLPGKNLGKLLSDAEQTDCRAMCVGPDGKVWAVVLEKGKHLHLVSYRKGDQAPRDHGELFVSNPQYTPFKDPTGKALPWHHGMKTLSDGKMTPLYHMGVCEARDGSVYVTVIYPFTVLKIAPKDLQ